MDLIWGPLNRPKFGVAKVCVCRVVRGRSAGPNPNSGPPGGLEFGAAGCASAQAFAFFKWINFALSEAPADRDPLIVNMDETALAYHIPAAQGTVATVATVARRAGGGQAVDHASLADTRGHVSYLATIASDPTVQPQLPQVILGNEHKFTLKALRSVAPDCPPNIHLCLEQPLHYAQIHLLAGKVPWRPCRNTVRDLAGGLLPCSRAHVRLSTCQAERVASGICACFQDKVLTALRHPFFRAFESHAT